MTSVGEPAAVRVRDEDIEQWHRDGWVIVEGVLDRAELGRAAATLDGAVPTWDQVHVGGAEQPYFTSFPFRLPVLDSFALHPVLIDFAVRALGGAVLLSHAEMLHKYAGHGDYSQDLHQDYGNNTLVVPRLDVPEQVASISYLTDSTVDMGPTGYVGYEDSAPWQHLRTLSRDEAPDLYARERFATAPAGSTLFYTQRTFHRGTAVTALTGARHTLHVAFQLASATWAGWRSLSMLGNDPAMATLLSDLSVMQRTVLGFPPPGHDHWTETSLEELGRRYPDMDLDPYRSPAPG